MFPRLKSANSPRLERSTKRFEIALCLSGGGYRAALFHLGVLRCLFDMGILQAVDTISSVSGGSILASYLARRQVETGTTGRIEFDNWENQFSKGFRDFVRNDIRTAPILANVAWNWFKPNMRAWHLRRKYSRRLTSISVGNRFKSLNLIDLPMRPYQIINATDLSHGQRFVFTREQLGNVPLGYSDVDGVDLAFAVTASSCFPPFFGPIVFSRGDSNIYLNDGGVYDNLGVGAVSANHNLVIISDGGTPFTGQYRMGILERYAMRSISVLMKQAQHFHEQLFHHDLKAKSVRGTYLKIGATAVGKLGAVPSFAGSSATISQIRTDLDSFSDGESKILENHGYSVTHGEISFRSPSLIRNSAYTPKIPHPDWVDDRKINAELRESHKAFSLSRLSRRVKK